MCGRLHRLELKQKQTVREQEASIAPKLKAAELQTELNKAAAEQHLEYLRSTQLMEATVQVMLFPPHSSRHAISRLTRSCDLAPVPRDV